VIALTETAQFCYLDGGCRWNRDAMRDQWMLLPALTHTPTTTAAATAATMTKTPATDAIV
jgi:hypothetical protein